MLLFSHSVMSDTLWPPCPAARQAALSLTISQSLLKFMSWWYHPLFTNVTYITLHSSQLLSFISDSHHIHKKKVMKSVLCLAWVHFLSLYLDCHWQECQAKNPRCSSDFTMCKCVTWKMFRKVALFFFFFQKKMIINYQQSFVKC